MGYFDQTADNTSSLDDTDTARRLNLLIRQYPELGKDPGALVGLASGGGDDTAMLTQASHSVAFADLQTTAQSLKSAPADYQRAQWGLMAGPRQQALQAAGYSGPPPLEHEGGGWTIGIPGTPWTGSTDIATVGGSGVVGAITQPLSNAVDLGAGAFETTLHAAGMPLRAVQHVYRTTSNIVDTGDGAGALLSPSDWAKTWDATSDGEKFFRKDAVDQATEQLGGDPAKLGYARSIAGGETAGDYAKRLGLTENSPEWHQTVIDWYTAASDPKVSSASDILKNGKDSPGRAFANELGIHDTESGAGRFISAAWDAAVTWEVDPLILAGKWSKATKIARWGIGPAEDVDRFVGLARTVGKGGEDAAALSGADARVGQGVWNRAVQIAGLADPEQRTRLLIDNPYLNRVHSTLMDWQNRQGAGETMLSPERVLDFFTDTEGRGSPMSTIKVGGNKPDVALIPHLTGMQQTALQAKSWFTQGVDLLADIGRTVEDSRALTRFDQTASGYERAFDSAGQFFADRIAAPAGKFVRALTTRTHYGPLTLEGPDAVSQLRRLSQEGAIGGMTRPEMNAWFDTMLGHIDPISGLTIQNVAQRQEAALGFLDDLFAHMNLASDAPIRQFVDRSKMVFGTNADDTIRAGDVSTRAALHPYQTAAAMQVPNAMALVQASRAQTLTKAILGGYTASPIEAAMTSVWKPAVLMHLGFIPRVAGEEAARFLLQYSPARYLRAVAGRYAMDATPATDDAGRVIFDDTGRAADWVPRTDNPEAMMLRPLTWFTGHLDGWANAAREEGATVSRLGNLTGHVDDYATKLAVKWASAEHTVAGGIGIPSKRELVKKFAGLEAVDNWRLWADSKLGQRSLAEHLDAALWGAPDVHAANMGPTVSVQTTRFGRPLIVDVPLDIDASERVAYSRGGDGYAHTLGSNLQSLAGDPVGQAQFRAASRLVSEEAAARLDQAAARADQGATPLDTVRNLKRTADQLTPEARDVLTGWLDDASLRGPVDELRQEGGQSALAQILTIADAPGTTREDIALLLNRHAAPDELTHDADVVRHAVATAGVDTMTDPQHFARVRDMTLAQRDAAGNPLALPITRGRTPLYSPMVDRDTVDILRGLQHDPDGTRRLTAAFDEALAARDVTLPVIERNHAVDTVLGRNPTLRALHGSTMEAVDRYGDTNLYPAALWGSGDPRVADAMSAAIHTTISGEPPILGVVAQPDRAFAQAAGTRPEILHTVADDPGSARSFTVHDGSLTHLQPLPARERFTITHVRVGGTERWVDPAELDQLQHAGDVKVLGSQEVAGAAWTQVLQDLAAAQADKIMHLTTSVNRVGEQTGVHSLLEALTRGPKPVETAEGERWLPSHLSTDHIDYAPSGLLPDDIYGPRQVAAHETTWQKVTNYYFESMVSPVLGSLSRGPMYTDAYGSAYRRISARLEPAFRDAETDARFLAAKTKLGLSDAEERDLRRLWYGNGDPESTHLPVELRDPRADPAKVNAALGDLLGLKHGLDLSGLSARRVVEGGGIENDFDLLRNLSGADDHTMRSLMNDAYGGPVGQLVKQVDGKWEPTQNLIDNHDRLREALSSLGDQGAEWTAQDYLKVLDRIVPEKTAAWHLTGPEIGGFRRYLDQTQTLDKLVDENATQEALNAVVPYIHDPQIRSQFQNYVGSLVPFWFAQEQFLKRWVRTISESPEALRRAQLYHNGLRAVGMIQTDPNTGNETFLWPGSDTAAKAIAKVASLIPGGDFQVPVYSALSGNTQMVVPGFSDIGAPSLGPVAAMGLHGLTNMFPEFSPLEEGLSQGLDPESRTYADYFVPVGVKRLWDAAVGDTDKGALASMVMQSLVYLEAHGLAPPPDAPASQRQDYLDRVKNMTRSQMAVRGLFSLVGPPGGSSVDYGGLHPEYRQMLSDGLDPSEAFALFTKNHPDMQPSDLVAYTVSTSKTPSGALIPQTVNAMQFADSNAALIHTFPLAAAWLIPQTAATDPRERQAYLQQLRNGLRTRRTPQEFMDQLAFAEGADTFFKALDVHQARLVSLPSGDPRRAAEVDQFNIFSQTWKAQHPVFADVLSQSTTAARRADTLDQLRAVLASPDAPQVPQADGLRTLMRFNDYTTDRLAALKWGRQTPQVAQQRTDIERRFIAWADTFIGQHPELLSFYNTTIRPSLPSALLLQDQNQTAA